MTVDKNDITFNSSRFEVSVIQFSTHFSRSFVMKPVSIAFLAHSLFLRKLLLAPTALRFVRVASSLMRTSRLSRDVHQFRWSCAQRPKKSTNLPFEQLPHKRNSTFVYVAPIRVRLEETSYRKNILVFSISGDGMAEMIRGGFMGVTSFNYITCSHPFRTFYVVRYFLRYRNYIFLSQCVIRMLAALSKYIFYIYSARSWL